MKERLDARLRYISDFAADVAHEFKSPLTAIGGAAELLAEGAADDPEARRRFLDNIRLDVERLDRLVSRLLELSRIEASTAPWSLVDLRALATRIVERGSTPDQEVRLRYELDTDHVEARETDLESAVMNLVENALRFSPPDEPVTIEIAAAGRSSFRLVVRDRRPGISAVNLDKVFDRFFTTDAKKNGTGLGLAIVKSVAESHGGRVAVTSEIGQGAAFTLTLPIKH